MLNSIKKWVVDKWGKFKKRIVVVFLLLSGGTYFAVEALQSEEIVRLQKVEIVGQGYFHTFQRGNGSQYVQEITEAQYNAYVGKDAVIPIGPEEGSVHYNAFKGPKFNTKSGRLEDNQYFIEGGNAFVKFSDTNLYLRIRKDSIVASSVNRNDLKRVE